MAEIELKISDLPVPYNEAVTEMEARVQSIHEGRAGELIWLLQHPSLYTAGTSAKVEDLVEPDRLPVFNTGRGGQFTYHGPGQRVVYVIFDLKTRGTNIRQFVQNLENWVIGTLAVFNVKGEIRDDRVGVWVDRGHGREDKIAAIGIRVRRWISYHGISINIDPDLSHYAGIVPCGITDQSVTSLDDLGLTVTMAEFDHELLAQFSKIFGGPSLDRSPALESLPR